MPLYTPPPMPTSYIFIDGESLRSTLKEISTKYFDGNEMEIKWQNLRSGHRKAFYYDAIPVQAADEDDNSYSARIAPKRRELAAIEREPAFHIKTGDVFRRRTRGNEQKMVDVQFAVDALLMASRGLFTSCTLVTGDLDFRPLVTALVDMGIDVTLMYPPGRVNPELIAAADTTLAITVAAALNLLNVPQHFATRIPLAGFIFKTEHLVAGELLLDWQDSRYGRCCIDREAPDLVRLFTETSPDNPQSHRLVVTASSIELMRDYVGEIFGVQVPY